MTYEEERGEIPAGNMTVVQLEGRYHPAAKYAGRTVIAADISENEFRLSFEDGARIMIWDDGQSCCESRYLTTDDDLGDLIGKKFWYVETKPVEVQEDGDESHEIVFVEIGYEDDHITLASHNRHNGYYSGATLRLTELG